jgi:hypothetical protein
MEAQEFVFDDGVVLVDDQVVEAFYEWGDTRRLAP